MILRHRLECVVRTEKQVKLSNAEEECPLSPGVATEKPTVKSRFLTPLKRELTTDEISDTFLVSVLDLEGFILTLGLCG